MKDFAHPERQAFLKSLKPLPTKFDLIGAAIVGGLIGFVLAISI